LRFQIGDSRIRNFFEYVLSFLGNIEVEYIRRPHHDIFWQSKIFNLNVDYFFAPFTNNKEAVSVSSTFAKVLLFLLPSILEVSVMSQFSATLSNFLNKLAIFIKN
jgi:hypothetical protein